MRCCDARKRRLLHGHLCANVGGHASQRDTCHGCHLCVVAGGNAVLPLKWRATWELLPLGEAGRGVPPPKKLRCPRRPSSSEELARVICTYISKSMRCGLVTSRHISCRRRCRRPSSSRVRECEGAKVRGPYPRTHEKQAVPAGRRRLLCYGLAYPQSK